MSVNQITGGAFQDTNGNPLANGYLLFKLDADETTTTNSSSTNFDVQGSTRPWNVGGGINTAFTFTAQGTGTSPVTIPVNGGTYYRVQWVSGLANVGVPESVNSGGYIGQNVGNDLGHPGYWVPTHLVEGELLGAFTNSSGQIVGTPLALGLDSGIILAPLGATFLTMGNNDGGTYADNTGTWHMKYSQVISGSLQICAGRTIRVPLDSNGNIVTSPVYSLWPNDIIGPSSSFYFVSAYTSKGQLVWGPNAQSVLSSPSPFDVGAWIPGKI